MFFLKIINTSNCFLFKITVSILFIQICCFLTPGLLIRRVSDLLLAAPVFGRGCMRWPALEDHIPAQVC